MAEIIIQNEQQAWDWLTRALDGKIATDEPLNLRFEGWPIIDLRFKGQDFDQSVPTRIMPPLLNAQKQIQRLFCELTYGEANLRRLKDDDKERLELNVRVKKGSSEYETNLVDVLNQIFTSAVNNMESIHILISVISASLIWGSNVAWKNWLSKRAEVRGVESQIQMSQLELEKMAIISKASGFEPTVKSTVNGVDGFRNDSLHKLKPADGFEIPDADFSINGTHAAEITQTPREQSIELRIDGEFIIEAVVSGGTSGFKLKVKRNSDNKRISVSIPEDALTSEQKEVLKTNEWNKRPIYLELNAREWRGQIVSASLVRATGIEDRA